jgi:MFS family permease
LAFSGGSLVGFILGGVATGLLVKRWGRQLGMFLGYSKPAYSVPFELSELTRHQVFTIVGVLLQWISGGSPGNLILFTAGKVLTGIPLGIFITTAPTYCAEVAPMALRGAVTAAVNFSIVLGQFLAYIVMRQTQSLPGPNAYRILFGIQWGFAAAALAALPFFPESPYHLVSQGKIEKAKRNVLRLHGHNFDAEGCMAAILSDLDAESKNQNQASFKECFKGTDRQRTLIATSTFVVQAVCGISWIVG